MSKTKQKIIIASGVVFLASAAFINSVYLPFYSDIGKQNPQIDREGIANAGGGTRGSMWANIEKKRMQKNDSTTQKSTEKR